MPRARPQLGLEEAPPDAADPSAAGGPIPVRMAQVDEALALVSRQPAIERIERVELDHAGGRVLADDVVARRSAPAWDVSAMDGYAVRDADLAADWNGLMVVGEAFAGQARVPVLAPRTAMRIFTGAPAPLGADRVVAQEDVRRVGDRVLAPGPSAGKRHIRRAGSDFRAGDVLVAAGLALSPTRLLAVAAADVGEVSVRARPRVIVVATGDELRAPGQDVAAAGSIPESGSFGVAELARRFGADVTRRRRLPDDLQRLSAAAAEMVESADVVVVVGGASVGERDYSRAMFEPLGLRMLFSKVAMRPGKPVWFGQAGAARVIGLPGNPTAAMVTARLFLAPLITALSGQDAQTALAWRRRPLIEGLEAGGAREQFIGARLDGEAVQAFANRDSSAQKVLAAAEALIRRRAGQAAAAPGDLVETLDF